jgi:hypothetical protein
MGLAPSRVHENRTKTVVSRCLSQFFNTLEVQLQEAGEDFVVGGVGGPVVGDGGGGETLVREVEPGGTGVVGVGERALRELFGAVFVFSDKAWVADGADGGVPKSRSDDDRVAWDANPRIDERKNANSPSGAALRVIDVPTALFGIGRSLKVQRQKSRKDFVVV